MRFLPLLALLCTSAAHAVIADKPGMPQVRVEVSRRGDEWSAEFQFDREVAAWVFPRSDQTADGGKPWRENSWTVETRGVNLTRRGSYDVFEADRGDVPQRVRVRFKPVAKRLQADYPPALQFTDGSVALYVAQFDLFPMDSISKVRALPDDLNNQVVPAAELHYLFVDSVGPVLLEGKRAAVAATTDKDTYVLFGTTRPIETPYMVGVLDPELPGWIKDSVSAAVPALLSRYTQELGKLPDVKPTIMISWAGPTPMLVARAGSALHGLIVMTYEGTGMLVETAEQRAQGLWFIAHEAAHFWLGQTVSYQYARDAWITEGGADLLAIRSVAEADPTYDPRVELDRSIADCIALTRRHGVESARDRNEHRAYYACGAVFGLVAEAGSGRSFYKFVRALIDANRADGIVSRAEWLAALDSATRKPDLSRDIARLLDRGVPDPGEFIAELLGRSGVDFTLDAAGIPKLR
ncbi:MAG: M1 family aminopeptidase [Pseudomonadota bacterium]